jgi:hypothetical protein
MRPDLQQKLFATYPAFFDHADSPSAPGGPEIDCDDGWFGLLERLFEDLSPQLDLVKHLSNPPRLYEIGKKTNRLRVLIRPLTPEMASYVHEAARLSETACEHCGGPREANEATTLCAKCATASTA